MQTGVMKAIATGVVALGIAQAASAGQCTEDHSVAYCLLDLASLSSGAKEVSAEKAKVVFDKIGVQYKEKGPDTIQAGMAAASFARVGAAPLPGLGWNGTGAMLLFGAFMDGKKNGQMPQFFFILNDSDVKNNNPYETIGDIFKEALLKYLDGEKVVVSDVEKNPTFGAKYFERYYKIYGGKCGENGCEAYFPNFRSSMSIEKAATVIDTPDWLGPKGKTYVWNRSFHANIIGMIGTEGSTKPHAIRTDEQANLKLFPKYFYRYMPGEVSVVFNSEAIYPLIK